MKTTQTTQPTTNNDEDFVWYCTKCMSLNIKDKETKNGVTVPYCASCGADVHKIDVTTFDRWEELYEEKYGHQLVEKKGMYDDLQEVYNEETPAEITFSEALTNGMIVRDVINIKWDE